MNLKRVRSLVLSVLPLYLPLFAACSTLESVAPESADPGEESVGVAAEALATACTSTIAGANLGSLALKSDGTVLAAGDDSKGQLGDGTTTSRSTIDGTGALVCTTSRLQGMGTFFGLFGQTSLSITAQQQQGCFAAMSQSVAAHGLSCHDPACVPVTCAQMGTTCGAIPDGCGGVLQCDECPAGQACGGSGAPSNVCGASCAPPQTLCATGCSDLTNDLLNCGACGVVCPMGSACTMGECSPFDGP